MKIALVSPYDFPYPGGVTEHLTALAEGLTQRGHQVQVLAACSGTHGAAVANMRVLTRRVVKVPIGGAIARVGLSPRSYGRIKRILAAEKFDVIHLQEPLTPGLNWPVLMQAHKHPQTVTIGTFHAYHEQPPKLYRWGRPLLRPLFRRLDALVAVSAAAREFAAQMFPGDYHLIPNGVDLARFGLSRIERSSPPTILFVGRPDPRKGFAHLVQAYQQLKSHYPALRLRAVGPFPPDDLSEADGIEKVGYVPPKQLPRLYQQADIFCAPSTGCESFGIVLLEAMAAGLPIVASDIVGYRSVLTHQREGLLVPPREPMLLADALKTLLDDASLRRRMGQQGRLTASRYNWHTIIDKLLELYQDTSRRKAAHRRYHLVEANNVETSNKGSSPCSAT